MHVSLTPELEDQVRLKVESGLYGDASEVVSESLRLLFKRDAMEEQLRDELSIGIDQLDRGQGIKVSSREEFLSLARGLP